jgi:hypothetical protein
MSSVLVSWQRPGVKSCRLAGDHGGEGRSLMLRRRANVNPHPPG